MRRIDLPTGCPLSGLSRFARDLSDEYQHYIVDDGEQLQLLILVTFLLTFVAARVITHAIGAGRWRQVFHNLSSPGGTYVHHLIPKIFLLLVSGFLGIGIENDTFRIPFAILSDIGAALTPEEFPLWLHREDVSWATEGCQHVAAMTLVGLAILEPGFRAAIGQAIGQLVGLI